VSARGLSPLVKFISDGRSQPRSRLLFHLGWNWVLSHKSGIGEERQYGVKVAFFAQAMA
jgi:hypothetical protein